MTHPDDEHVPTAEELVVMKLAHKRVTRIGRTSRSYYVISNEGYRLIREAMARNAQRAIARGDGDWVQPPSSRPRLSD